MNNDDDDRDDGDDDDDTTLVNQSETAAAAAAAPLASASDAQQHPESQIFDLQRYVVLFDLSKLQSHTWCGQKRTFSSKFETPV